MRKTSFILALLMACTFKLFNTKTFIGSGQTNGISVETSQQAQHPNWMSPANAINIITGSGNELGVS